MNRDISVFDGVGMKTLPAPSVPGNTDAERMDNAVRAMFSVPKDAYLKQEVRLKRSRDKKRCAKTSPK